MDLDLWERSYRRILVVFGLIFLVIFLLGLKMFRIQVWDWPRYAKLAVGQRQDIMLRNELRGDFLDRNGQMLRGSRLGWYLAIRGRIPQNVISDLEGLLGPDCRSVFEKNVSQTYWIYPHPLSWRQVKVISGWGEPSLQIISSLYREQGSLAWHLLGHVSGNRGLSGLEYLYDPLFKEDATAVTVFQINDGLHQALNGLGLRSNSDSKRTEVYLTLDRRMQQVAENVLDREQITGAIVILDVKTGEILAMASRPMVDLNNLAASIGDNREPFINRAISAYHPGSIFKLVILSAGLDSGALCDSDLFNDPGYFELGSKKWFCTTARDTGHGIISLGDALAYSCNPVFMSIALQLKPELILEYADKFGFGQPCNVGLQEESWGTLPASPGLTLGDQVNIALGEQDVYTTPLQVASMIQTIANDGVRIPPRLILGYLDGNYSFQKNPAYSGERILQSTTARTVQEMMAAVTTKGTGQAAKIAGGAGGKTGTAQSGTALHPQEHAWFAGFAPLNRPRYAAVVFCEQGISGGQTAAPIFREVMTALNRLPDIGK